MPLFSFEGRSPTVSPDAWIAPTATFVGDVTVGAGAPVRYGAVLRADFGAIVVRAGANVQDGSVLHGGDDQVTAMGGGATVGPLEEHARWWVDNNPGTYQELARRHRDGVQPA